MNSPFFSVIIPVYNVENYLDECISSVLQQKFSSFEIILVDDGSTDRSSIICDHYCDLDNRINVIHKANGGLSSARNAGIKIAKGMYLLFLDSDDYWSREDALSCLYEEISKSSFADILFFQTFLEYPGKIIVKDKAGRDYPDGLNYMLNADCILELLHEELIPGSACTLSIKRPFLLNNKLYFQEGIKSEDIEWLFRVVYSNPRMRFINLRFYIYRKGRIGSISNTVDYAHLKQYAAIIDNVKQISLHNVEMRKALLSMAAYHIVVLMGLSQQLSKKKQRDEICSFVKQNKEVLQYDSHPKVKIAKQLTQIVGVKNTCRGLGFYLKVRNYRNNKRRENIVK